MLEKLTELKGIEVFFIYLSSLMRAADISFAQDNNLEELKEYKF